jgi:hypothetical protein
MNVFYATSSFSFLRHLSLSLSNLSMQLLQYDYYDITPFTFTRPRINRTHSHHSTLPLNMPRMEASTLAPDGCTVTFLSPFTRSPPAHTSS